MANITTKNDSRQPMFLVTTGILLLFSIVAVVLRLYCRTTRINYVGLDDYSMVVALLVTIGMTALNVSLVGLGTGQHFKDLDFAVMLIPTLKHLYAFQIIYPLALFFVKTSILALYYRIFSHTAFRWKVYFVAGFVSVYTIIVVFINAFECGSTPSRAWTHGFPKGCINPRIMYLTTACVNIITDVVIFLMPMGQFRQLNLATSKRWALFGVFMVGGIAVIASIVRIYAIWLYNTSKDIPYDVVFILLLSQIEVSVGIISASAPAIQPLFKTLFPSRSIVSEPGNVDTIGSAPSRCRRDNELQFLSGQDTATKGKSGARGSMGNSSEESILKDGGITKTMETTVEYDERQADGAERRIDSFEQGLHGSSRATRCV